MNWVMKRTMTWNFPGTANPEADRAASRSVGGGGGDGNALMAIPRLPMRMALDGLWMALNRAESRGDTAQRAGGDSGPNVRQPCVRGERRVCLTLPGGAIR